MEDLIKQVGEFIFVWSFIADRGIWEVEIYLHELYEGRAVIADSDVDSMNEQLFQFIQKEYDVQDIY